VNSDLRETLRAFLAEPAFVAVVVLTLALAIGATTTIFSVVHGVLLRPLPYEDPDRLVTIWESQPGEGRDRVEVSAATYLDWRERTRAFERIGAWRYRGFTLTETGEPERLTTVEASPALFRVLGASALVGRTFTDAEERPGDERYAILSHGAWSRRFGGRNVLDTTIRLDGLPYTVVGVMPPDFQFPPGDASVEIWTPLTIDRTALLTRPHRMYFAMGRLAPGVSLAQARADMEAIGAEIARAYPDSNAGWGVTLVPAHAQVVGDIGPTLWVLFGAVVLVLLIACANIANLLLARSARAAKDFAVRAAFGAGAWPLLRRSLVESAVLAAAGGGAGLALAYWGIGVLRRLVPASVPRADGIGLDPQVLTFTGAIAIGSGVAFGLVPAWRAMRPNLMDVLQEGTRGSLGSRRARRLSNLMVAAEVSLALVLLVGAGLLIRSFVRLTSVDPGFRTSRITALHIALPQTRYTNAAARRQFFSNLLDGIKPLPGLSTATAVSALPMSPLGVQFEIPFTIDGLEVASPSDRPRARYRAVMPDYFKAMAIALRRGRVFTPFDGREDGPKVAVVNETLARRYFSNVEPIDRMVRMPMAGDLKIVGVVADIRHDGLQATAAPEVFVPYVQFALSEMQVVIESDLPASAVTPAVKTQIARLDPQLPIVKVSTIEELLSASIAQPRFNMALLVGLAVCAAVLAAVGVYGVVTYSVTRRTAEIGLRMALGADEASTFRLVVFGALRIVLAGVVVGLAGAAALGRTLEGLLFGVRPLDPATYAIAGVAVIGVGLLAASLPAIRAARIDPADALRQE
jgi:predicted permease